MSFFRGFFGGSTVAEDVNTAANATVLAQDTNTATNATVVAPEAILPATNATEATQEQKIPNKAERDQHAQELKAINDSFKFSENLAELAQVMGLTSPLLMSANQLRLQARLEARLKKSGRSELEVKNEDQTNVASPEQRSNDHLAKQKALQDFIAQQVAASNAIKAVKEAHEHSIVLREAAYRAKQASLREFVIEQSEAAEVAHEQSIVRREATHRAKQDSLREFVRGQSEAAEAAKYVNIGTNDPEGNVDRVLGIYNDSIENLDDSIEIHQDMLAELSYYRQLPLDEMDMEDEYLEISPELIVHTETLMARITLLENIESILLQKLFEAQALREDLVASYYQLENSPSPIFAKGFLLTMAQSQLAEETKNRSGVAIERLSSFDQANLSHVTAKIGTELPKENPAAARADKFPLKQLPGAPISFANIHYYRRDTVLSSGMFKTAKAAEAKVEVDASVTSKVLPPVKNPEQVIMESEVRAPSFVPGRRGSM